MMLPLEDASLSPLECGFELLLDENDVFGASSGKKKLDSFKFALLRVLDRWTRTHHLSRWLSIILCIGQTPHVGKLRPSERPHLSWLVVNGLPSRLGERLHSGRNPDGITPLVTPPASTVSLLCINTRRESRR